MDMAIAGRRSQPASGGISLRGLPAENLVSHCVPGAAQERFFIDVSTTANLATGQFSKTHPIPNRTKIRSILRIEVSSRKCFCKHKAHVSIPTILFSRQATTDEINSSRNTGISRYFYVRKTSLSSNVSICVQ